MEEQFVSGGGGGTSRDVETMRFKLNLKGSKNSPHASGGSGPGQGYVPRYVGVFWSRGLIVYTSSVPGNVGCF